MIFVDLPTSEAAGALLVHSIRIGKLAFRKGRLLSAADVAACANPRAAGRFLWTFAQDRRA